MSTEGDMENESEIKVGDVVTLNSGGMPMTVTQVRADGLCAVAFFADNVLQRDAYFAAALKIAPPRADASDETLPVARADLRAKREAILLDLRQMRETLASRCGGGGKGLVIVGGEGSGGKGTMPLRKFMRRVFCGVRLDVTFTAAAVAELCDMLIAAFDCPLGERRTTVVNNHVAGTLIPPTEDQCPST